VSMECVRMPSRAHARTEHAFRTARTGGVIYYDTESLASSSSSVPPLSSITDDDDEIAPVCVCVVCVRCDAMHTG
jgi:hypothetical protein